MQVSVSTDIKATPQKVWKVITDIENSKGRIKAIQGIEVLEPAKGPSIVGLKWRETRTMFGKEATEVMWVTGVEEGKAYDVRAESHGAIYRTRLAVEPLEGGTRLSMSFHGQPVTFGAKLMWALMGFMMKGSMRKALQKDLEDIKAAVET
jgi:carbon monoxide dehydrogenase subunit G